jgi:signal transduction histidine kinase
MIAAALALGWAAAAGLLALVLASRRELDARMERLARAAHELRRPLTAARLAAHGLPGGAAIDRELARAGRLLGDLDAVRGAPPALLGEPVLVVVPELLASVAAAWRPVATAQGRRVVVERRREPLVVRGDEDRLAQALGNLVANALEHGAGEVRLGARGRGGCVELHVSDGGPGLGAPLAELVGRTRDGRGTRGRGLAIASELARAHGGALRAGPGARLVVALPAAAGTAAAARTAS